MVWAAVSEVHLIPLDWAQAEISFTDSLHKDSTLFLWNVAGLRSISSSTQVHLSIISAARVHRSFIPTIPFQKNSRITAQRSKTKPAKITLFLDSKTSDKLDFSRLGLRIYDWRELFECQVSSYKIRLPSIVKPMIIPVTRIESTSIRQIGASEGKMGYSWK